MSFWKAIATVGALAFLSGCASDIVSPPYKDHPNLKVAETARQRGDLPQAIHDYRDIIRQSPMCENAYIGLGKSLLDANVVDESKETFDKAITLFPRSAEAYTGLGSVYLVLDQPENAIKSFERALKINPCLAKAMNGYGIALDMLGRYEEAQVNYRGAMELDPRNPSFESNLALSMVLSGNPEEAIRILERLARSPKVTPRIRQNLALAYGIIGDMKMARKLGRMDLPDKIVANNIAYLKVIRETQQFGGLIPKNHTPPLDQARAWENKGRK